MTKSFRLFIFSILASLCHLTAAADNTSAEINSIKRASGEYIYAESTMPTEDEARHNADNLLISNINSYFEQNSPEEQFTPALVRCFKYMKMKRSGGIRVFAYISKADLGGKPVTTTVPVEPVTEPEETTPAAQEQAQAPQPAPADEPRAASVDLTPAQRSVVDDLLSSKDMQSAMKLLTMFEAMRKIKGFGTVNDVPADEVPFWLIGTGNFGIDTVISGGDVTVDLRTGQSDSAARHKGVPMLWFLLK